MIHRTDLPQVLQTVQGFSATNVVYNAFGIDKAFEDPEKAPPLPFVVYYFSEEEPFNADGINYYTATHCIVELYTKYRNLEIEQRFENVFTSYRIPFNKTGDYLNDDQDYMIAFDFYLPN